MALSNIIKELRILNKMTQKELADICCVSRNCISNWECATRKPGVEDLVVLSKVFNYPLEELIQQLLFEKSVNSIVYNSPKKKLKIPFVVPIMNIIIVTLVCAMLSASIIINNHFHQKAKYVNDSTYVQNIENITLNLKYLNNNYYFDFIYNEQSNNYEINDLNFYRYFHKMRSYSRGAFSSNHIFMSIQIKCYDSDANMILKLATLDGKRNYLDLLENEIFYFPFQDNYLDFLVYIQESNCYVGAFTNEKGD